MTIQVVRILDKLLRPHIVTPINIELERNFHRLRNDFKNNDQYLIDSILYDLSVIDAKSTALLTHISVIIAALVFSLSFFQDWFFRLAVGLEIIAYFLVTLVNLRCVYIMGPPHRGNVDDSKLYEEDFIAECLMRRTIYMYCLRSLFVLTSIIPIIALFKIIIEIISFLS